MDAATDRPRAYQHGDDVDPGDDHAFDVSRRATSRLVDRVRIGVPGVGYSGVVYASSKRLSASVLSDTSGS
jgi:hypothetical protein